MHKSIAGRRTTEWSRGTHERMSERGKLNSKFREGRGLVGSLASQSIWALLKAPLNRGPSRLTNLPKTISPVSLSEPPWASHPARLSEKSRLAQTPEWDAAGNVIHTIPHRSCCHLDWHYLPINRGHFVSPSVQCWVRWHRPRRQPWCPLLSICQREQPPLAWLL